MRGHGDNRKLREARVGANPLRGLIAVHAGHLNIHQHEIVRGVPHGLHGFFPILRRIHLRRRGAQNFARQLLIQKIIFHQQNFGVAQHRRRLGGRRRLRGLLFRRHVALLEHVHDGIEQERLFHRLDEKRIDARFSGLLHDFFPAKGGHHDNRQIAELLMHADAAAGFDAIHFRHDQIHQHQIERRFVDAALQQFQRLCPRTGDCHLKCKRG